MATKSVQKVWTAQTWIEGSGAPTFTTLSGTTEEYSDVVDLGTNGYEGAQVVAEVDFDATPTDNVKISIYGSLDGTNFDDTPLSSLVLDNGTDPNQVTFTIKDLRYFRVGFQQTGATDSHNVRAFYAAWGWQIV